MLPALSVLVWALLTQVAFAQGSTADAEYSRFSGIGEGSTLTVAQEIRIGAHQRTVIIQQGRVIDRADLNRSEMSCTLRVEPSDGPRQIRIGTVLVFSGELIEDDLIVNAVSDWRRSVTLGLSSPEAALSFGCVSTESSTDRPLTVHDVRNALRNVFDLRLAPAEDFSSNAGRKTVSKTLP
jgi:hypothetical protein